MAESKYAWTINEWHDWPPPGHPKTPISPSMYENICQCRLKVNFQCSPSELYPRRVMPSARIGTAFHQTLEQLSRLRHDNSCLDLRAFCQGSIALFQQRLLEQRKASDNEPREHLLKWPDDRLSLVEEAIVVLARRIWLDVENHIHPQSRSQDRAKVLIEYRLESGDGLLAGIIDRVELTDRCQILDYKTSLVTDEKRHAQQIKLYASLWFDRHGIWPDNGLLIYVLLRHEVPISIDPEECSELARRVREEARAIMRHPQNPEHLANPGPECRYCEFRPWCRPFWNNQSEPIDDYMFIKRAQAGFEAIITLFRATIDVTLVELETCGRTIELRFPKNQFPHLEGIRAGDRLRVLDTHLVGVVGRPTADITERTEIYKIQSNKMGDPSERG